MQAFLGKGQVDKIFLLFALTAHYWMILVIVAVIRRIHLRIELYNAGEVIVSVGMVCNRGIETDCVVEKWEANIFFSLFFCYDSGWLASEIITWEVNICVVCILLWMILPRNLILHYCFLKIMFDVHRYHLRDRLYITNILFVCSHIINPCNVWIENK